ncbi:hypothetical protein ACFLVR_03435 [Chloroflexota bacterium]
MKRIDWKIWLGVALVVVSAVTYAIHFAIFRDAHHIFIYMVGDIAFVPIEVLMVVLIVHRLLDARERRSRLEKLNMVIGAFFGEIGTSSLTYISDLDLNLDSMRKELIVTSDWDDKEFDRVSRIIKKYNYEVQINARNLGEMKQMLTEKMEFLIRMFENPILLEHETFTDLLRAVFHLADELANRDDVTGLPDTDMMHLTGDTNRAYGFLAQMWLEYMEHLKDNYPYLFSLAMRVNPFDKTASPVVMG